MSIRFTSALCSLLFAFVMVAAEAANVRTAGPMPTGMHGGSTVVLDDGRILAYGGGGAFLWDPELRQWQPYAEAARQPRRYLHATTIVSPARIVFSGGLDPSGNRATQQTALSSVTIWRPKDNAFEAGPGLLAPRFGHAAVALPGGDLLVIGGSATADREQPFGSFLATVERLGDKTTTARAPMRFARARHTANVLPDGRVIVIGGLGDDRTALASVEIYDANTNTWLAGPSLETARMGHTTTLLADGRILIVGGTDANGVAVPRAEILASDGRSWRDAGEMLAPRSGHAATILKDGSVLVSGGIAQGQRAAKTLERWIPEKNDWVLAGESPLELRGHQAALLPNGSVLLFGSDMYERDSGVLVWLPDEPEQQYLDSVVGASLTDLQDGRVLLAGGSRRQAESASASVYDLRTNRWVATAPMHFARSGHRAVRLEDGRVLVAGGYNVSAAEIWDPRTNRWTVTDEGGALAQAPRPEVPEVDVEGFARDTRWSNVVGSITTADGKTYVFRTADVAGRTFPRLDVVWLNKQARRWQPNTNGYVERDNPAMLALSATEVMVAGGASAVVQILNTTTSEWRYTGFLPVPMRAPSILSLRDGGVMVAGRSMENEATVVCALWNPENSIWSECGQFTSDSVAARRVPVLKDLGDGQTLLVYGNERALVRGKDGTWVATKLDFPNDQSMPQPSPEGIAYTTNLGSVWDPAGSRWVDATEVLMAHRHGRQAVRAPDRSWLFSSSGSLLRWQPQMRIFSQPSLIKAPENNFDSIAPLDGNCAILWNGSRELASYSRAVTYVPVMYARSFATDTWSSGFEAPTAPIRASSVVLKGNTLILAGASRDPIAGGSGWQQYRATCDQVTALAPVGSAPPKPLYLPTRPPSAKKEAPVKAVALKPPPPDLNYVETWKATAAALVTSVRRHIQGTFIFGAVALLLIMRLATRWEHYQVDDEGRTPGRLIDLAILGGAACALVASLGIPWPTPQRWAMAITAAVIVFVSKRLWANIEAPRDKVIFGVPLGAGAIVCGLTIGTIIIGRLAAMIDYLRDY